MDELIRVGSISNRGRRELSKNRINTIMKFLTEIYVKITHDKTIALFSLFILAMMLSKASTIVLISAGL